MNKSEKNQYEKLINTKNQHKWMNKKSTEKNQYKLINHKIYIKWIIKKLTEEININGFIKKSA